ncbi:UNKNOWN [Stylonychia lemnae]|uniref:Uncharacterized protein n=1 Tax=Stylonychia lemnae TaxID=5949 RepID=A0A077ZUM0_STYLE|nr:UNKNOWN [Stylonychia lemnae]|eukprot:CDW73593.1 UNKNOWN [Stylonychia lemnae]
MENERRQQQVMKYKQLQSNKKKSLNGVVMTEVMAQIKQTPAFQVAKDTKQNGDNIEDQEGDDAQSQKSFKKIKTIQTSTQGKQQQQILNSEQNKLKSEINQYSYQGANRRQTQQRIKKKFNNIGTENLEEAILRDTLQTPQGRNVGHFSQALVSTRNSTMIRNHLQTPSNRFRQSRKTMPKKPKLSVFKFTSSNNLEMERNNNSQGSDQTEMEKYQDDQTEFERQSMSSQTTYFQRGDETRSQIDGQSDTSFARIDDSRSMKSGMSETSFRRIDSGSVFSKGSQQFFSKVTGDGKRSLPYQKNRFSGQQKFQMDGMSQGQSTIMMEGEAQWDDYYDEEYDDDSNLTDFIILRDEDQLDVTEFYKQEDGDNKKQKKRSKSLDQGKQIDIKEVAMKKTQMVGYNYDPKMMTSRMSEVKKRDSNNSGIFQFPKNNNKRARMSERSSQMDMQSEVYIVDNETELQHYYDEVEYGDEEENESEFRRIDDQSSVNDF